jgi:hypothetical protein
LDGNIYASINAGVVVYFIPYSSEKSIKHAVADIYGEHYYRSKILLPNQIAYLYSVAHGLTWGAILSKI